MEKEAAQVHETQRPGSPYVPLIAEDVAEPSNAERIVPMLEALPPELAAFYSKEDNVLADGCKDGHSRSQNGRQSNIAIRSDNI